MASPWPGAGQASFQLGRKVSVCGDTPCSSQNREPPREQKCRSCRFPRDKPSAGSLLLCAHPQGYLKGPWCAGSDSPGGGEGEGGGARVPVHFCPSCSKGLLRAPGNRRTPLGLLQILYAVIKSELLHFILPQFAHL